MITKRKRSRRRPIVVGNWKMHKTVAESVSCVRQLSRRLKGIRDVEIWIAPSFTALRSVFGALKGTGLHLAAQNLHEEDQGGFTGEISPIQIRDAGCRAALIGHSERRHLFGETNVTVNRKVSAALRRGLLPMVCVGETLEERRADQTTEVIQRQLRESFRDIDQGQLDRIIVGYEPVWAIGTGRSADPAQISDVHELIRRELMGLFGPQSSDRIWVLYGGSVTTQTISNLASIKGLDGVLVGGASLRPEAFTGIVKKIQQEKKEG